MRKTLLPREGGFTLLEVVFAVSILAIGMMGYTALKISNRYSWVFARNLTQALQLTGANLEGLRLAGYNDTGWLDAGDHSLTVKADGTLTDVDATNDADRQPEFRTADFTASSVEWTVRANCPSPLTKMVTYNTNWNLGGDKRVTITQVQVRQ